MGIFSRVDELLKKANKVVGAPGKIASGLLVGAAKGVADLPREFAELGSNIGELASRTGVGKKFGEIASNVISRETAETARRNLDTGIERTGLTTPEGTAQKIGYGAEKLAEFLVPGTASKKLASITGKIAPTVGKGVGIVSEALGSGAVSSVQTGGDIDEAKSAVIFSGLGSLAAPVASKVASWLNKKVAPRVINSLVKPSNKEFEFGKDAGAAILDEGLRSPTMGGLLKNVTERKKEVGALIDANLSKVDDVVDVTPALSKLDDLIVDANTSGERELAEKYRAIKEGITGVFDPTTGVKIGEKDLTNLSALEAQQLKTKIGDAVQWYNTPFEGQTNQARVSVYRAINDIIDTVAPGTKKLNMRYANMLTAQTALMRRMKNIERSNLGGLLANLAGGAGTLAGLATNGIGIDDVALGVAAWGLTKFAGSTAGRTLVEAPLVKGTASAIDAVTSARAPLAGIASKIYDAVFGDNSVTPSQERSRYEEFINAATERGVSEEEIKAYLEEKKGTLPVRGAF